MKIEAEDWERYFESKNKAIASRIKSIKEDRIDENKKTQYSIFKGKGEIVIDIMATSYHIEEAHLFYNENADIIAYFPLDWCVVIDAEGLVSKTLEDVH